VGQRGESLKRNCPAYAWGECKTGKQSLWTNQVKGSYAGVHKKVTMSKLGEDVSWFGLGQRGGGGKVEKEGWWGRGGGRGWKGGDGRGR